MITKRKIDLLTTDEVLRLLRACGRSTSGKRTRALVTLWWRGGLRLDESLSLHASDVHVGPDEIYVRRGKGGRPRRVPIDADAMEVIQAWISERAKIRGWSTHLLIGAYSAGHAGRPMSQPAARMALARIVRRAGLEDRRIHPHMFRHVYAAQLDRERVPIAQISRLLGHASIATTAVYLDHVSGWELHETIGGRAPWLEPDFD